MIHAYMTAGSAAEFSITMEHGYIEPTLGEAKTLMPFQLIFCPKMYGKVLQGMLVVDTLDSQYIFDVVGKTPEYVPPVIKSSPLGQTLQQESLKATEVRKSNRRNVIRENIENAKRTKPRIVSPSQQGTRPSFK